MVHYLLLSLFIFSSGVRLWAQDEVEFRRILSGIKPPSEEHLVSKKVPQFTVIGPSYQLDLNGDGIEESILPQKRDGVDWIEIRDHSSRKLFEGKLFSMGAESSISGIRLIPISTKTSALIIFLDDGITYGKRFESTGRIYVMSWEGGDLSKIVLFHGPHFYHEKEFTRNQYFRRTYLVDVLDIDKDGIKEIIVHLRHMQKIMKYNGYGEWSIY